MLPRFFMLMLGVLLPAALPAQRRVPHTDKIVLQRDIDFSGRTDHVVLESRQSDVAGVREYRMAVYLDVAPQSQPPHWATPWNIEFSEIPITAAYGLSADAYFLQFDASVGDGFFAYLLVITRGQVHEDVSYAGGDDGFIKLSMEKGRRVIDAAAAGLRLRNQPVIVERQCKVNDTKAVHLVFDAKLRAFAIERTYCAPLVIAP